LRDGVRADRDEPAVPHLELAMEFKQPLRLAPVLGAVTAAAQDEDHRIRSLEFGELPALRGVIGKLVVGEQRPGNDVRSHLDSSSRNSAWPLWRAIHRPRRQPGNELLWTRAGLATVPARIRTSFTTGQRRTGHSAPRPSLG